MWGRDSDVILTLTYRLPQVEIGAAIKRRFYTYSSATRTSLLNVSLLTSRHVSAVESSVSQHMRRVTCCEVDPMFKAGSRDIQRFRDPLETRVGFKGASGRS